MRKGESRMTDETQVENVNEEQALETVVESEVTDSKPESMDDALKLLEELQSKNEKLSSINKEVIDSRNKVKQQLRKFEKQTEEQLNTELAEQGKYKELYEAQLAEKEALQSKIRNNSLDKAFTSALAEADAKSVNTVMKLVDKDNIEFDDDGNPSEDSILAAINAVKESDPILFGSQQTETPNAPPVKRATEGENLGGYDQEIRACTTQAQIESVMKKYGKAG
jgi:hypothetical protein